MNHLIIIIIIIIISNWRFYTEVWATENLMCPKLTQII